MLVAEQVVDVEPFTAHDGDTGKVPCRGFYRRVRLLDHHQNRATSESQRVEDLDHSFGLEAVDLQVVDDCQVWVRLFWNDVAGGPGRR